MTNSSIVEKKINYNSAKLWQIGFFALNNTATNLIMFAMGFVSYYATGVAGLAVVLVSIILTSMRIFDGITDPIVGYFIDKTNMRFGKFRPFMVIGNIIMISAVLIIFNVTHLMPESFRIVFFVAIYVVYDIGYTFQTACTKSAQTVLTNHPKQRPLFSNFDAIYNIGVFTGGQIVIASYLVPKHGGFVQSLFTELNMYAIILSVIFTVLAVIGIWSKDRKEYFGLADQTVETKFRDYWPILKRNRPLQMLIVSAASDKLATKIINHPAVPIMFFGILLGDYALSGQISMITVFSGFALTLIGIQYSRKVGMKKAFVLGSWMALISFGILVTFLLIIGPNSISLVNLNLTTIGFLILYCIGTGCATLTTAIVIPMISDTSDYETYTTGRYVPGMIGTAFSFVDKLISSLSTTIIGVLLATIGFKDEFPQIDDALTPALLVMTLVLKFGFPIFGWAISIIAMRFYKLDYQMMNTIQQSILEIKENPQSNRKNVV